MPSCMLLICRLAVPADSASVYLRQIKQLAPPDSEDPEERPACVDMRVKVRCMLRLSSTMHRLKLAFHCVRQTQRPQLQQGTMLRVAGCVVQMQVLAIDQRRATEEVILYVWDATDAKPVSARYCHHSVFLFAQGGAASACQGTYTLADSMNHGISAAT
jgi:hypothetical protein